MRQEGSMGVTPTGAPAGLQQHPVGADWVFTVDASLLIIIS